MDSNNYRLTILRNQHNFNVFYWMVIKKFRVEQTLKLVDFVFFYFIHLNNSLLTIILQHIIVDFLEQKFSN